MDIGLLIVKIYFQINEGETKGLEMNNIDKFLGACLIASAVFLLGCTIRYGISLL